MNGDAEKIVEWLINNEIQVHQINLDMAQECSFLKMENPLFAEEIEEEYKDAIKTLLVEEISRQTGIQMDIIYEVLETPGIEGYINK